ncbi:MAG: tRNA (adenosine(37)-N6)-threonylcarbamoyltransferase complex transferase subunit TsaD [Chloroflexi bacterium]|nr:tRNA (adenosine(37)-N6)-threonylcarbamoyltransferase complex transferase subunit TsaD [Chloroflexota bacterium]
MILGIETSCDETAAAVVEEGTAILSNVVASQVDLHAQYGGIFPEVASRAHIERIYPVVDRALKGAGVTLADLEGVAVTQGPGLPGSLVVGINMAKGLALGSGLPLYAINHLEGHLYSLWLSDNPPGEFPIVALVVSGGHTELLLLHGHGEYQRLGGTLDDAAGEAFDKVGRLLGLPYPGGPSIQRASEDGDPNAVDFPRVWLRGDHGERTYNFSFSGLKTQVLREIRRDVPDYKPDDPLPASFPVADMAASFQAAVVEVLVGKTVRAAHETGAKEIHVSGGVSANAALREAITSEAPIPVRVPPLALTGDNAAMIAAAAYWHRRDPSSLSFDVRTTWRLGL